MKNIKKVLLIIFCTAIVFTAIQTTQASYKNYTKTIPEYADISGDKVYEGNLKVGRSVKFLGDRVTVNGDLYISEYVDFAGDLEVKGNLIVEDFADFAGNVIIGGTAKFGKYTEIEGTISAYSLILGAYSNVHTIVTQNYAKIQDYADITNMIIGGDLEAGDYLEVFGKIKVLGNIYLGDYANIEGTLYGYKNINIKDFIDILGSDVKFKIVGNVSAGKYYDNTARTYIYGTTSLGEYADEKHSNYSGLFGKIDPLLKYNLSESKVRQIKQKVDNYLYSAQQQTSTQKKQTTYTAMFNYLSKYIEEENFDRKAFENIQVQYKGKTNIQTTKKTFLINTNYTPILPTKLKNRLEQSISSIPENNRAYVISVVIEKIDVIVASSRTKIQTKSVIEKINILLGIKEYLESYSQSSHSILGQLGL